MRGGAGWGEVSRSQAPCVCPSVCPWGVLSGLWGVTGQASRRGSPNLSLAVRAVTGPPLSPKPRSRARQPRPHPLLDPGGIPGIGSGSR